MTATTISTPTKPQTIAVNPDAIPAELRSLDQWVAWKSEDRGNGSTKIPRNARTGGPAYTMDGAFGHGTQRGKPRPEGFAKGSWSTFDDALTAYQQTPEKYTGIGFVFTSDDPFVGIDLDNCRDLETGQLEPWAQEIVTNFSTYSEVSPSGTGVKLFGKGIVPAGGNRAGNIEIYDRGRYFTVTGHHLDGTPDTVIDCQAALNELHNEHIAPAVGPPTPRNGQAAKPERNSPPATATNTCAPTDAQILAALVNHDDAAKIARLLDGDTTLWDGDGAMYPSQSEADFAVIGHLSYFTPDGDQIERILRATKLRRPKWDRPQSGTTWLRDSIDRKLANRTHAFAWDSPRERAGRDELPAIDAGCQNLPTLTKQGWEAIQKANQPERLFRNGSRITRLERDDDGQPLLREITKDRMQFEAAASAFWFRWKKIKGEVTKEETTPPDKVVRNLLATPDVDLPRLVRIVEAPVFAADGTLQTAPGYHAASRTFYAPADGFVVPDVPEQPTPADVDQARTLLLDELLGDFPFTSEAERSNAIAMGILPAAIDLIDDRTPLHLFEKPSPGTGATLLVDMLVFPSTGRPLNAMTEGRDEDEWRKRITAIMAAGRSHVLVDNLKRRLESAAVSSAITSVSWEDRKLGKSEIIRSPVRCVWVATGNNPAVSSEIARRTIRIRLDAKVNQPWRGRSFRHPDIRGWASKNRGHLVWAILVLIRAWLVAGQPKGSERLGMFEKWSETIGGILDVAGIPDFLGNLDEFYEKSDAEGNALQSFIGTWWGKHSDGEVGVRRLWNLVDDDVLDLDLGDGTIRSQKIRFGKLIAALRDRVFTIDGADLDENPDEESCECPNGGASIRVRVERAGTLHRAQMWKLRRVGE